MSDCVQFRWRFWIAWLDGRIYDDPEKGKFTFALERPEAVYREALVRAKELEAKGVGRLRVQSRPSFPDPSHSQP